MHIKEFLEVNINSNSRIGIDEFVTETGIDQWVKFEILHVISKLLEHKTLE